MGDRTYCQIEVAEADEMRAEAIIGEWGFGNDRGGDSGGTIVFEDSEADDGGSEARDALEKAAMPFIGYHDSGGGYGARVFACDGVTYALCLGYEGEPVCRVGEEGQPEEASLQGVREYLEVKRKAHAAFEAANKAAEAEEAAEETPDA